MNRFIGENMIIQPTIGTKNGVLKVKISKYNQ